MKNANYFTIVLIVLLFSMGSVAIGAEDQKESKIVPEMNIKASQIIRVNAISGINPAELNVERGTTVIWINESQSIVELPFEGKQVTMACMQEPGSFYRC